MAAEPPPVTVCLTQLWEVYDYDYDHQDEFGGYAEYTAAAWTVEVKHTLPGGMIGWRYVGFIQFSEILYYDSSENQATAWWSAEVGRTGEAATTERAVRAILECAGPVGGVEVQRR